ncbi:MAG TPA: response regulator [Actinomycetota bacterium]|nr:response regulator [Actinomycetota bacterium]
MKVLLVEDDSSVRALLSVTLGLEGGVDEIREADNGDDAVAVCATWQPDAIVVDGHMRGVQGDELGRALRECAPNARIISFTGVASEPDWATVQVVKASDGALDRVLSAVLT